MDARSLLVIKFVDAPVSSLNIIGELFTCTVALHSLVESMIEQYLHPRTSHYKIGPGKNLQFSVESKWRVLAMMAVVFGSGFSAPFVLVWHQMLKK
ncbi:hypothetical protein scyTo_0009971 [Scyliorhinus torazame]|uniref:Cytochrome c oxidase subunit 7C, mitochondrial n=1 Tax=Scyliorhinus torazame TaxID=75743 RepID=A0A401NXF2_SCYTO|nr:hypothetical protein [Scyliorhinus torazame]